jgi:hypothetical protein
MAIWIVYDVTGPLCAFYTEDAAKRHVDYLLSTGRWPNAKIASLRIAH